MRSSGILRSVEWLIPCRRFRITYRSRLKGHESNILIAEDGIDMLSRNVGKESPLLAA